MKLLEFELIALVMVVTSLKSKSSTDFESRPGVSRFPKTKALHSGLFVYVLSRFSAEIREDEGENDASLLSKDCIFCYN